MARILLADDDAATRDLVKRALATDGHAVSSTQDGTEALERLQEAPDGFDLLISDVQMPGLDGVALAEKGLAGNPQAARCPHVGFCRRAWSRRAPEA